MNDNICDKCGQEVKPHDNAVLVYLEAGYSNAVTQARHLFASSTCEGSPSMAQYFEGQPRDAREWYPLNIHKVQEIREAYKRVLKKANQVSL